MSSPDDPRDTAPTVSSLGEAEMAELARLDPTGGVLRSLVALYAQDALARVAGIEEAARLDNASSLADLAHLARGAALTFGARVLAELATSVELSAREGVMPTRSQLTDLRAETDRVLGDLTARALTEPGS